ncbi:MAG: hypothetical protein JW833_10150 [Prolixibacteraceae bacterium]|nr:hypothetical protein [Prolixibacteraceae bacterium]
MKDFFNNQRILDIIWKRKFHFIIIGILAIIISAFFSGPKFITPKYKSTARIYPTRNIFTFSKESATEQILEILNSRDIKLRMFDAFNLEKEYGINREDPHFITQMIEIYNSNVNTSKTEFETVEIRVFDEDPQQACAMCDSIISFLNIKVAQMHAVKYLEIIKLTNRRLRQKYSELDTLQPKYDMFRKNYNIFNYNNQAKEVTRSYMRSFIKNSNNQSSNEFLKSQFENLKDYGIDAQIIENRYLDTKMKIDSMIETKVIALEEANKKITYSHIVETPIPADKKSYPVRWFIVALSLFSALFAGLVFFLILDYKKQ